MIGICARLFIAVVSGISLTCSSASNLAVNNQPHGSPSKPLLIAHRGASGYAPEHTLASYQLAIDQGADFVEQDLQLTKDGALVCLHDPDLGRTTNVAEVFSDRATERDVEQNGKPVRGWFAIDFTLAEIKRLDAGSWFNRTNSFAGSPSYAGQRVPTLEEVIGAIGNRAGLYIELKNFPFYKSLGFDTAAKLVEVLNQNGFNRPERRERVLIQSFSKQCLLRLRELAPDYRRVQLLPMEETGREKDSAVVTAALAKEVKDYATGVGPAKALLKSKADVDVFHTAGLVVHPYTFRGPTSAVRRVPLDEMRTGSRTLRQEMIEEIRRYLAMGIDGGFTDYPSVWREAAK